jgi:hypothetical protein
MPANCTGGAGLDNSSATLDFRPWKRKRVNAALSSKVAAMAKPNFFIDIKISGD